MNLLSAPDLAASARRAEHALLGGIFRCPSTLDDVAHLLVEDDFREAAHRAVWRGLLSLYGNGQPIDLVGVAEWLNQHDLLGELTISPHVTGFAWLAELWDANPTGALVSYHAQMVRDHSLLRRLSQVGERIAHRATHPDGSAQELLEAAERDVFALADDGLSGAAVPLAPVVDAVLDQIDARMAQPATLLGLPTGISGLDSITAGLQCGELILFAARPSVGKTAIGLAVARNAAALGHTVLFCSLEQSRQELAQRLLIAAAGVDGHAVRHAALSRQDLAALAAVRHGLVEVASRLWVDDESRQTVMRIAGNARRLKHRANLALVVIDYVQIIEPEDRHAQRHEQVGAISRRLKALARELSLPVVALAQLRREVEDRADQKPKLSDLRESGSLEQDADTVVLLHRQRNLPSQLDLHVAKQRNGPVDELSIHFDRARMRFDDLPPPSHG
jgi:replicative DNA helicase